MGAWTSKAGFTDQQIGMARTNLLASANYSWELGVATQAILEYDYPRLSVFGDQAVPPPRWLDRDYTPQPVLDIAHRIVQTKPMNSLALVVDDAVGDPPSIGGAVLLANWTRASNSDGRYAAAAGNQLGFLLNMVIRTEDGAISHRREREQLWSDFIYMTPPFIAYFGALQFHEPYGARALMDIAYDQIRLYRNHLRDPVYPGTGLWRHIVLGGWEDLSFWATGNAWALCGILRVLETIRKAPSSGNHFHNQTRDLTNWAEEIVAGAWRYQAANGTLFNTLNRPNGGSFPDSAGTALIAAGTFRLAMITRDKTYIPHATRALLFLKGRVDSEGWLVDVVDPLRFNVPGERSPEAQAFILLLQAAWRDYTNWL